jgi:hypothetical protein
VRPDKQYHLQILVESTRQGEEEYALGQLGQNEAPKRKRWRGVDQGHSLTLRCYLNKGGIWLRIPTLCVRLILKAKYFHSTDVLLHAQPCKAMSCTWRSILKGVELSVAKLIEPEASSEDGANGRLRTELKKQEPDVYGPLWSNGLCIEALEAFSYLPAATKVATPV